jgi:hypothetical protein
MPFFGPKASMLVMHRRRILAFDELDQLAVLLYLRLSNILVVRGIQLLDVSDV